MSTTEATICTLVFLRRGDQILLAFKKRGFGQGQFNGVGGKIEPGETLEQTMIRETQEEIGVTPTHYEYVAKHHFMFPGNTADIVVHTYLADAGQGEPVETEEMRPQWFGLSEIPYEQMWDDDKYWLPSVLLGKKLVTHFRFADDERTVTAIAIKPLTED